MRSSLRQPLGGERPEVLDVVGDHGAFRGSCNLQDDPVATSDKVISLGHCDNVETGFA